MGWGCGGSQVDTTTLSILNDYCNFPAVARAWNTRLVLRSWTFHDVGHHWKHVELVELWSWLCHPPPCHCGGSGGPVGALWGLEDHQCSDQNFTEVGWTKSLLYNILNPTFRITYSVQIFWHHLSRDLKAVSKLVRLGLHVKRAERQNLTVPKVFRR